MQNSTLQAVLRDLESQDGETRFKASQNAATLDASALPELTRLAASDNKGTAKAARRAMELCAHHAARPGARGEAQAMAKTLVMIASHPHAASVRVHVINLAGYVGDGRVVPQIAPLLMDESREVRDAARIALERIPGSASDNALKAAAKSVRDEDKPAILQSLANRAKTPKTVGIKG